MATSLDAQDPGEADVPRHVPVLLDRCLALLAPAIERPGAVVVDATLGLGGHSEALLTRFPDVRLVGLDRDTAALELLGTPPRPFSGRTLLVHAVYDELPQVLAEAGLPSVDGVLFDLGVSSMQLDEDARGFAYSQGRAARHAHGPVARASPRPTS